MMPATMSTAFPLTLTEIAGQPVPELARRFGTPVYVYDAARIARRIVDLAAFDVVRYAQKACSHLAILDLVRRHGGLVDCVSAGEVHRAITAGFQPGQETHPPEIVYTADIFDRESLDFVIEHDVHVNCGSPDMIDQYGEALQKRGRESFSAADFGRGPRADAEKDSRPLFPITLRINPGFGHGHSQKVNTGGAQSKHGIWHAALEDCIERATKFQLRITGLHMHIGSGTDLAHLAQVCGAMEQAALVVGSSIRSISAGGGLPIDYREGRDLVDVAAYYELWNATRHRLAIEFGHEISLEIEPGRYLVAESGYLISEIRAIKTMGENRYYLVDAGFNNLARPILYGAYHPMAICPAQGSGSFSPGSGAGKGDSHLLPERPEGCSAQKVAVTFSGPLNDVVVGGPLCESGDIFTQEEGGYVARRALPEATVGDFLIIGCAGAYGSVMASNYNSKPLVAEVLIENGQPHLIRRRQTLDDLVRGESIPGK
jgi:diaminopimelate decarboxylase